LQVDGYVARFASEIVNGSSGPMTETTSVAHAQLFTDTTKDASPASLTRKSTSNLRLGVHNVVLLCFDMTLVMMSE